MTQTQTKRRARNAASKIQVLLLGMTSIAASFALGIQSAGEVQTVSRSAATSAVVMGDMNDDGLADVKDAMFILECARGYATPTEAQLMADPSGDGELTIDDALLILKDTVLR